MTRRRTALILAVAAAVGMGVAAGGTRGAHASPVAVRPPVTIRLGEFFFRPRHVVVHVGQKVRFVNVGKIAHTVADTTPRHAILSQLIKPRPLAHGQQQVVVFRKTGTVYYLCTFHPTLMRGTITVVR